MQWVYDSIFNFQRMNHKITLFKKLPVIAKKMVPLQAGVCYPEEKVRGEVMKLVYGDEDQFEVRIFIVGNMYIAGRNLNNYVNIWYVTKPFLMRYHVKHI